ncbi:MAG TPA: response regulator transcription factor [Bacteroidia bacterium]
MIYRLLAVDGDPDTLEFLKHNLSREGFEVFILQNSNEAIGMAETLKPHLLLLEVTMPGTDGISICAEIRESKKLPDMAIVFLTARSEEYTQLAAFKSGADDYITKPIRPRVLSSRLHALLKRIGIVKLKDDKDGPPPSCISQGDLSVDNVKFLFTKCNEPIALTKKEFALISLLMTQPGKVWSRDDLLSMLWKHEANIGIRIVDAYMRKLREKIGKEYIKTIIGVGYGLKG